MTSKMARVYVTKDTRQAIKILAALLDKDMSEIVGLVVAEKLERLQIKTAEETKNGSDAG